MGTAGAAVVVVFTSLYYSSVRDTLKSMTQMWLALMPAWLEYLVLKHYIGTSWSQVSIHTLRSMVSPSRL